MTLFGFILIRRAKLRELEATEKVLIERCADLQRNMMRVMEQRDAAIADREAWQNWWDEVEAKKMILEAFEQC